MSKAHASVVRFPLFYLTQSNFILQKFPTSKDNPQFLTQTPAFSYDTKNKYLYHALAPNPNIDEACYFAFFSTESSYDSRTEDHKQRPSNPSSRRSHINASIKNCGQLSSPLDQQIKINTHSIASHESKAFIIQVIIKAEFML